MYEKLNLVHATGRTNPTWSATALWFYKTTNTPITPTS